MLARAMVLPDRKIFVAGPPDLVDEEQAFRKIDDPDTQQQLARQATALDGAEGGLLWVTSASDGTKLAE